MPVAFLVLVVAMLVAPQAPELDREGKLTTYGAGPSAARGVYEITRRLGWHVARRTVPLDGAFSAPLDTTSVYAVLDPVIPLSLAETRTLLDAVRRGAGLVYVLGDHTPLADSLHVRHADSGYTMLTRYADSVACSKDDGRAAVMWFDNRVHLYRLLATAPLPLNTAAFLPLEESTTGGVLLRMPDTLATARRADSAARAPQPATGREDEWAGGWGRQVPYGAVGFPVGRGRVVAVADPDVFRNDVVRVCKWGVGPRVLAMLDWAGGGGGGPRRTLVFDEYHQGYGAHASIMRTAGHFLVATPAGRGIAQGIGAALVLLLAMGVRPIAPTDRRTIERRSPLEHVAALAQAYQQIGATRVAARRLARGLRRRHGAVGVGVGGRSVGGGETGVGAASPVDDAFLSTVAARYPEVAADVARLRGAERERVSATELVAVAEGVERIDEALAGRQGGRSTIHFSDAMRSSA